MCRFASLAAEFHADSICNSEARSLSSEFMANFVARPPVVPLSPYKVPVQLVWAQPFSSVLISAYFPVIRLLQAIGFNHRLPSAGSAMNLTKSREVCNRPPAHFIRCEHRLLYGDPAFQNDKLRETRIAFRFFL